MSEISSLRQELDQVHQELFALLQRRFQIADEIWKIKKAQGLPLTDLSREESIIHQFDELARTADEKIAVQNILKCILRENRQTLEAKFR